MQSTCIKNVLTNKNHYGGKERHRENSNSKYGTYVLMLSFFHLKRIRSEREKNYKKMQKP